MHQFRAMGLGQRPFLDAAFSSHLKDLETFRRIKSEPPLEPATSVSPTMSSSGSCYKFGSNIQTQGKPFLFFSIVSFVEAFFELLDPTVF